MPVWLQVMFGTISSVGVLVAIFGRPVYAYFKSRDQKLDFIYQHYDKESALSEAVGGAVPARIDANRDAIEAAQRQIDAQARRIESEHDTLNDAVERLSRAETKMMRLEEHVSELERQQGRHA